MVSPWFKVTVCVLGYENMFFSLTQTPVSVQPLKTKRAQLRAHMSIIVPQKREMAVRWVMALVEGLLSRLA